MNLLLMSVRLQLVAILSGVFLSCAAHGANNESDSAKAINASLEQDLEYEISRGFHLDLEQDGQQVQQVSNNFIPRGYLNQSRGRRSQWTLMPEGLIYKPYLAGAKESRIRSVWNDEKGEGGIWDISLGGQAGLLRYGSQSNGRPTGWQLGIEGAGLVRLDLDVERDVMATDYRFGIPLTWGNTLYQVKFAYYHLSSHLGDEFLLKNPGFTRLNYSRDVLVFGVSHTPFAQWRVYSEAGYAFRSVVAEPWEFQFGIDYAPEGPTGFRGQPFAAFNGQLREEVDFGGNVVFQVGWAWRRSPASGMFRTGVEYYNGKSDQFSFFDESEQKVGFGMWYDY